MVGAGGWVQNGRFFVPLRSCHMETVTKSCAKNCKRFSNLITQCCLSGKTQGQYNYKTGFSFPQFSIKNNKPVGLRPPGAIFIKQSMEQVLNALPMGMGLWLQFGANLLNCSDSWTFF